MTIGADTGPTYGRKETHLTNVEWHSSSLAKVVKGLVQSRIR